MRSTVTLAVLGFALLASAGRFARAEDPAPVPAVTVPTYANATCPIMGKPTSLALFTDTDYGRIYVCCPPCIAKIKQDPARAASVAYPVVKKAGNTVCPVTGEKLGEKAVTVVLQGYEIGISDAAHVAEAKANAQITLAKALNPKVVDVGNKTCPITGKPVANNAFALVGDDLIRLSSPKDVDAVKADPAKALKAAKDIAAKQAAAK